ncbi:MAG: 30S ribosome-binding factor RbfA [Acidobacteriota bacterium]
MRRPEKLAEALKEVIAEVVGYELDDPRVTMVTVTEVTVSDDLRDAKVYVLINGTEAEINEALKALKHASVFVRQQVTLNLSLRYAPHLHFVRDTAEENASKITQILGGLDIKPENEERKEDEA